MPSNYNKDPRIINYHKILKKNNTVFRNNKFMPFSLLELNYIVNVTEFKYDKNKLYILNLNDYNHFTNQRFLTCHNGFYCNYKNCNYMHVRQSLFCSGNYHKIIKCNEDICNLIHIRKCKFNNKCHRYKCIFIHDKNKK